MADHRQTQTIASFGATASVNVEVGDVVTLGDINCDSEFVPVGLEVACG